MSALKSLQDAIDGHELDVTALEDLVYKPEEANEYAEQLITALIQLVTEKPNIAAQIPRAVIPSILAKYTFNQVLEFINFTPEMLENPVLLGALLSVAKEKPSKTEPTPLESSFHSTVFPILSNSEVDIGIVSMIEDIAFVYPSLCLKYLPYETMYNGSAELKSRLMALNGIILDQGLLPPLDFVLWSPLESFDGDFILAAIEVDYIGDLTKFIPKFEDITLKNLIVEGLRELCTRYQIQQTSAVDRVFAKLAAHAIEVFEVLDMEYQLVTSERVNLLSLLPPKYVNFKHAAIVSQLHLKAKTVAAVVNIIQDPASLRLLPVTEADMLKLPIPMQLDLAAAGTSTEVGCQEFASRFSQVLKNAYNLPINSENMESQSKLRQNLKHSGVKVPREASVAIAV